ncbi:MAG: hypothetical protein WA883_11460, partial [Phormidesmis sp.]
MVRHFWSKKRYLTATDRLIALTAPAKSAVSNEPLASSPDSAPDSALQTVVSISAQQSPFPVKTVAIAIAALILGVASLISVQPKLSPKRSTTHTAEPTIEQASEPTETATNAAIDAANSSAISSQ